MRRILWLLLLLARPVWAQFTTVTGTVVDPNGLPYALGTIVPSLSASTTPTLNGFAYSPPIGPVGLDNSGSFTMNLASQASLLPAGTTWSFTVCSAVGTVQPAIGTGPQCFVVTGIVIAGASQSISAQLTAAALALSKPGGSGTVTSVGLTVNSTSPSGIFTVTGSPVTTSGTLNFNLAGTSGGVPYFSSGTVLSSSAALTANTLVKGGGVGVAPSDSGETDDGTTFTIPRLVSQSATDTTTTLINLADLTLTLNPSGTKTGASNILRLQNTSTPTQSVTGRMRGILSNVSPAGSQNISRIEAGTFTATGSNTATVTNLAIYADAEMLHTSGTTTNNFAIFAQSGAVGTGGTITNDAGVNIQTPSTTGTMTHHYGTFYAAGQSTNTGGRNPDGWAIFVQGPGDKTQLGSNNFMLGSASGTVNIVTQAAAGTPVLTLPTNTGTFGVTATSPITLSATTGDIGCASCLTNNGLTTAGFGTPVQVARVRAVSQIAAIGTTTLLATGGSTADYLVVGTVYCDTTSAAATVSITISYTDSGSQAQTISPTAAACTALGSSSFALINSPIVAKNGTNIQYATSIANTPTYDVRIDLYQLGSN